MRRALRLRVLQVFKQHKEVTVTAVVPLYCRHQSERVCRAVNLAGGTNSDSEHDGWVTLGYEAGDVSECSVRAL